MTLSIRHATKSFGKQQIFAQLSFDLGPSEIVGLFGRNGSGKSTLLNMIFGTLPADSMAILLGGKNVSPKAIIPKKIVGFLPQVNFLPPHLTIRKIIPLYYQDEFTLDKIFYAPKVVDFELRKPGELSAGQLKYLELLLISNLDHPFLLLDEPFSMVDPQYKDIIKELLLELKEKKGILITDHYYQDVLQITDRNLLLSNGKMREVSGAADLIKYDYLADPASRKKRE